MVSDFFKLAMSVGQALQKKSWKLAIAESCTGGGLSQAVTCVPGSSGWFDCGWVTYSNESKQKLLGVQQETLETFGAVSEEVAKEMVQGALKRSIADITIAVTGIAGPDGGTVEKPVGTVWFACGVRQGELSTKRCLFSGDRSSIRQQAVLFGLNYLKENV